MVKRSAEAVKSHLNGGTSRLDVIELFRFFIKQRTKRFDVTLFPFDDMISAIAKPAFVAYWLRQGVVPDADFIAARPEEFPANSS